MPIYAPQLFSLLPGVAPTVHEFEELEWPQSATKTRNGRTVRWMHADGPGGGRQRYTW